MKKAKLILAGMISLTILGLLLPLPAQALLVSMDSPIKDFFSRHVILLCVVLGCIQGVLEEGGYYLVMKKLFKKSDIVDIPFWFGAGRSALHTMYDIVSIVFLYSNGLDLTLAILSRAVGFVALIQLTKVDYVAYYENKIGYLVQSIILYAILSGYIYSYRLDIMNVSPGFVSWSMIIYAGVTIVMGQTFCPPSRYMKQNDADLEIE